MCYYTCDCWLRPATDIPGAADRARAHVVVPQYQLAPRALQHYSPGDKEQQHTHDPVPYAVALLLSLPAEAVKLMP